MLAQRPKPSNDAIYEGRNTANLKWKDDSFFRMIIFIQDISLGIKMQVDRIHFRLMPVQLVPLQEPAFKKYRICFQRYIRVYGKSQLTILDQNLGSFPFDTDNTTNQFDFQIFGQEKQQFSYQFALYGINNKNRENRLEIVEFNIESEYTKFSQEKVDHFVQKTIFPQSSMQLHWTILMIDRNNSPKKLTTSLLPFSRHISVKEKPKMDQVINDDKFQQVQKAESVKISMQPNEEENVQQLEQSLQVKTSTLPTNLFLKQEVKSQKTHEVIDSSIGESRQPEGQAERSRVKLKEEKSIKTEEIKEEKSQFQFEKKKLSVKNIFLLILFFLLIGGLAATQIYLTTQDDGPKKSAKQVKQGKQKKSKK